jgi:hypothetical protein
MSLETTEQTHRIERRERPTAIVDHLDISSDELQSSSRPYLVCKPDTAFQRVHLDPTRLLPFVAANVLEEEDERMYRLQNLKCRGVERIEVVLKVSRCSMLGYHAPLVNP